MLLHESDGALGTHNSCVAEGPQVLVQCAYPVVGLIGAEPHKKHVDVALVKASTLEVLVTLWKHLPRWAKPSFQQPAVVGT